MDKETAERYSHKELPPVKNPLVYTWHIVSKLFLYMVFGTSGIIVGLVAFPFLRVVLISKKRFQKVARKLVSRFFHFFVTLMTALGFLKVKISREDKKILKNSQSKIIIANHPSILDVVIMISYIPQADCIVRGGLTKTPLVGVIRWLYIINNLGYEELHDKAEVSLKNGTNLIIFPEGTRTPRHGTNPYKRGAAHLALDTKSTILPIYIGGNDKFGLGKHDGVLSYNPTEKYTFTIKCLPEISTAPYEGLENQIAARRLTKEMHRVIAEEAMSSEGKTV